MKKSFLSRIGQIDKYGNAICIERLSIAMTELAVTTPFDNTLVITGTNGKGTTAMLCEHILRNHKLTTALFTSPHFIEFNERFQINGQPIEYAMLNQSLDNVLNVTSAIEHKLNQRFGVFEILFLVALEQFKQHPVDVMIFEAGIGGRYDPVRLLKAKLCALTSIDLEHTQLLGNSLELIGYDKLDAVANNGEVVIGQLPQGLLAKLQHYGQLRAITVSPSQVSTSQDPSQTQTIDKVNITTATVLSTKQLQKLNIALDQLQLTDAIANYRRPGRFEKICYQPSVYIDAAHTPQAYELLFNTITCQYADRAITFVVGLSQGRDSNQFAAYFKPLFTTHELATPKHQHSVIVTQAFKGIDAHKLASAFKSVGCPNLTIQADLAIAYQQAKQQASQTGGRVFVVGGLFLAGATAAIEQNRPYKDIYLY